MESQTNVHLCEETANTYHCPSSHIIKTMELIIKKSVTTIGPIQRLPSCKKYQRRQCQLWHQRNYTTLYILHDNAAHHRHARRITMKSLASQGNGAERTSALG